MISNIEQADFKKFCGELLVVFKGEVFKAKDHIHPRELRTGDFFLHPQGIYKVRKSYRADNAYALSKPVVNVDLPGTGSSPYAGYQEIRGNVTRLEKAENESIDKTFVCQACEKEFSFRKHGIEFKEKAKLHIKEKHLDNGEPDDEIVNAMLFEKE